MICSTWARVDAATSGRPLRTFDTVGTETPASDAIWAIVVAVVPVSVMTGPDSPCASFGPTLALVRRSGHGLITNCTRSVQNLAKGCATRLPYLLCGCRKGFETRSKAAIAHEGVREGMASAPPRR